MIKFQIKHVSYYYCFLLLEEDCIIVFPKYSRDLIKNQEQIK